MLRAEVTAMTTLHTHQHVAPVSLRDWISHVALGLLIALPWLLLRVDGAAMPDRELPGSPFVVPGAPDLYTTIA